MKKLFFLLIILTSLFSYSQINDLENDFHMPHQTLVSPKVDNNFVLDSIITKLVPSGNRITVAYYDYYLNGNQKVYELYRYYGEEVKVSKKYEYEYDDENRITSVVEYGPASDTTFIRKNKSITNWYNNDYYSERVNYSYNGTGWIPITKILSPDLGQPSYFTSFNFNWNVSSTAWDTVSKTISYINGSNRVYEAFTYQFNQSGWITTNKIISTYTNSDDLLLEEKYNTYNNGNSYVLDSYVEYEYTLEGQLTSRRNRWDIYNGWYYLDNWFWNDNGSLDQYAYFTYSPLYPESQGGIIYKNYYDEQGLLHHRNLYNFYTHNHTATGHYYYSVFTVNTEEKGIPEITCYPNPFSSSTTIEYNLSQPRIVEIYIYNEFGVLVEYNRQQQSSSGKQKMTWKTNDLPSGLYYIIIKAGNNQMVSQKVIVVK